MNTICTSKDGDASLLQIATCGMYFFVHVDRFCCLFCFGPRNKELIGMRAEFAEWAIRA